MPTLYETPTAQAATRTVTVNEPVAVLPAASEAVAVDRRRAQREARALSGGARVTATLPLTMSRALAEKVATAPAGLLVTIVCDGGQGKDGRRRVDHRDIECAGGGVFEIVTRNRGHGRGAQRERAMLGSWLRVTATSPLTRSCARTATAASAPVGLVASSTQIARQRQYRRCRIHDGDVERDAASVFPAKSWAVAVTGVEPSGKRVPDGGVNVTGTTPSKSSVALPS